MQNDTSFVIAFLEAHASVVFTNFANIDIPGGIVRMPDHLNDGMLISTKMPKYIYL